MKGLLLLLVFILSTPYENAVNKWTLYKDSGDVKVFYRKSSNSRINELKILTRINSNLSTIVEAITDVPAYPKWVYGASSSKLIGQKNAWEQTYYNMLDFPWPLSDRDVAIRTKITQNKESKIVESVSISDPYATPELKDVVRIRNFHSQWTFTPKTNYVDAEYVFSSDPGGNLPAWLINMALDEGPLKTINGLKSIIASGKYDNTNILNILN